VIRHLAHLVLRLALNLFSPTVLKRFRGPSYLCFCRGLSAYRNWDPTEGRRVRKNQVGGSAGLSPGNGYAVGCWHIKTCIFGRIRKLEKNGLEIEQGAEKSSRNLRKL
jgi:hypothetical protein